MKLWQAYLTLVAVGITTTCGLHVARTPKANEPSDDVRLQNAIMNSETNQSEAPQHLPKIGAMQFRTTKDNACLPHFSNVLLVVYSAVWGTYADPKFIDSIHKPFFPNRVYAADRKQCSHCQDELAPTGQSYLLINSTTKHFLDFEEGKYGWAAHRALLDAVSRFPGYAGYMYLADDVALDISVLTNKLQLDSFLSIDGLGICGSEVDGKWIGRTPVTFERYRPEYRCSASKLADNPTYASMMQLHGFRETGSHCQSNNPDIFYLPARFLQEWGSIANIMNECGLPFTLMHAAAVGVASPSDFQDCGGRYSAHHDGNCFQHPFKMSDTSKRQELLKSFWRDLETMCPSTSTAWMSVATQASADYLKSFPN